MIDNGEIQLLPESRKKIDIKIPGENRYIVFGFVLLIIVGILYGGLIFYTKSIEKKISDIDVELLALEDQRDKDTEDKILVIKDQLKTVDDILDNHVIWTRLLTIIQARTSLQSQFKNMNIRFEEEKVSFNGEALNYTTVARQLVAYLEEDIIRDIDLGEVKLLNNGRVSFQMDMLINTSKILLTNISTE